MGLKKNLYYEIKDIVTEERQDGVHAYKQKIRTKVYGLNSTKSVRQVLIDILIDRAENHKDKFICPLIHSQLETMEVKRNGRWEHADNAHDDQIFSYLMALYIFYEGKDVMERWNIYKHNITTDTDEEEGIMSLEEKYDDVLTNIKNEESYERCKVEEQLSYLNSNKAISFEEHLLQQEAADEQAMRDLLNNNPLARKAYSQKYANEFDTMSTGMVDIPTELFMDFGKYTQEQNMINLEEFNKLI